MWWPEVTANGEGIRCPMGFFAGQENAIEWAETAVARLRARAELIEIGQWEAADLLL
jgi:hypothetical protein